NDYAPPDSPYRVSYEGDFRVSDAPTGPPDDAPGENELEDDLEDAVREIYELQRRLYAHDRYALLLVFQALDAAGKDSTIRHVTTGVNPAGFQVYSFKEPSKEELDHDFLWRTTVRLPERGRIGIFNRSYYEEVLVVRVHPEYLAGQRLPRELPLQERWAERYRSIREHEAHLARNGTVILKFWLNISKEEQARRFIRRIDRPDKNWKFSAGDLDERERWDDYMVAFEDALNATSRPWAPWYAIPADDKPFMRATVAGLVRDQLAALDIRYPRLSEERRAALPDFRSALEAELP
ncbi:MAG: polyphosphate kinase 2 family protein, partial [Gemmatimonadota bacterium]|nr:polyphosphate kinase 2 family protein [Gemmatimonadota bacterium]